MIAAPESFRPFVEGLRVLDLTTALAGPYCTAILADLGADVISIEPLDGDPMRSRKSNRDGISYPFEMVHHDKRSVAVDIRDQRAAEMLTRLAGTVDVVVENFRPGVLARRGLDAASLRSRFPSLIYCSISGYGHTGPLSGRAGVDLVAQGHAGLMSVTGEPDGPQLKAGYPVSDVGAGMWAAIGVLGALARRSATGEGATVDVALTDSVLAWAVWEVADYQMTGVAPRPLGTSHRLAAPYQAFRCGDGAWLVFAGLATRWPDLCDTLGVPHLVDDPRFHSESARYASRDSLAQIITDRLSRDSRDVWLARLEEIGIPAGPINDITDVLNDDQFRERDMFRRVRVEGGEVTVINSPIRSGGCPGVRSSAPAAGEHTGEVLAGLGYDADTIAAYAAAGLIRMPREPE